MKIVFHGSPEYLFIHHANKSRSAICLKSLSKPASEKGREQEEEKGHMGKRR